MRSAQVQGRLWGAAPDAWVENERFAIPFYEAVFEATRIGPGTRLLDVGCGAGLAMVMAKQRGATVTGIDASEGLVQVARQRLLDEDLRIGDVESLPYADATFDVVTSFNAVQFASDPVAALRETRRVAVAGGQVALVSWGPAERCDIRFVLAAVAPLMPPSPPGAPGPFALSEPGKLQALAQNAGLEPIDEADVAAPFTFTDMDDALRIQLSAGPFRSAIEHSGEQPVRDAVAGAFEQFAQPDGSYRLNNEFRYLVTLT